MVIDKKGREVARMSNQLASAGIYPVTSDVYEERILVEAIRRIKNRWTEFNYEGGDFFISAHELRATVDSQFRKQLERTCAGLMTKYYATVDKTGQRDYYSIFDHITIKDGRIHARFGQAVRPHLLQLAQQYTDILPDDLHRLKTPSAQQLFRLLSSYKRFDVTEDISIENLLLLTGNDPVEIKKSAGKKTAAEKTTVKNTYAQNTYDFLRRVIKPALKEIAENTPLKFTLGKEQAGDRGAKNKLLKVRFVRLKPENADKIDDIQQRAWHCYQKNNGVCTPKHNAQCKFCYERGRRACEQPPFSDWHNLASPLESGRS